MSNVTSIAKSRDTEADPLQAERAKLDISIKMAWKYTCAVTNARNALDRGVELLSDAEKRVEASRAAIDAAREADGKAAAKALRQGEAVAGGAGLKAAKRTLADAEADAETASAAIAELESGLADAIAERASRANTVLCVRNELLRPFAEKILEQAARLHRDFKICEALASEILNHEDRDAPSFDGDEIAAMKAQAARTEPFSDLRKQASAFFLNRTLSADTSAAVTEAVAGLRAAVAALAKDPSTPLPPLP